MHEGTEITEITDTIQLFLQNHKILTISSLQIKKINYQYGYGQWQNTQRCHFPLLCWILPMWLNFLPARVEAFSHSSKPRLTWWLDLANGMGLFDLIWSVCEPGPSLGVQETLSAALWRGQDCPAGWWETCDPVTPITQWQPPPTPPHLLADCKCMSEPS